MADLVWPGNITPYRVAFYLQPHVGGSESPMTRTRKRYGLSAPRWVCRLTFRGGYNGEDGVGAWGGELDALLAEIGGLDRVALWDFRRPYPVGLQRYYRQFAGKAYPFSKGETFRMGERFALPAQAEPTNEAAAAGASQMTFIGFLPGEKVFQAGDYIGGDGRPHIVRRPGATADADGRAVVHFDPPLASAVGAGAGITMQPTGWFQLANPDEAAANETEIGQLSEYVLDFVEDL